MTAVANETRQTLSLTRAKTQQLTVALRAGKGVAGADGGVGGAAAGVASEAPPTSLASKPWHGKSARPTRLKPTSSTAHWSSPTSVRSTSNGLSRMSTSSEPKTAVFSDCEMRTSPAPAKSPEPKPRPFHRVINICLVKPSIAWWLGPHVVRDLPKAKGLGRWQPTPSPFGLPGNQSSKVLFRSVARSAPASRWLTPSGNG